METLRIGAATIDLHPSGLTVTHLPEGEVPAWPPPDAHQIANALALGYGDDIFLASREHELAHALLAHLLGLSASPTLRGVAAGKYWPCWRREEAACLGLQGFARAAGVSLIDVARRVSTQLSEE